MYDDKTTQANSLDSLLSNPFATPVTPTVSFDGTPAQQTIAETLTPEHQQRARALAGQIDYRNPQAIIQYGVAAQTELSRFSHTMLNQVRTKDSGPVGEVLIGLMGKIREVDPDDFSGKKGFFSRLFSSAQNQVQQVISKYNKLGAEVDKIGDQLERHRQTLFKDIMMLEQLYEKNKEYYDALNIYIAAGELRMQELNTTIIPQAEQKAQLSNDQMLIQEVNDLRHFADRLEKRVHDLKISRHITIQMAPQIRMIQHTNQTLVERIQSSILTSIPLWKNQLVISLSLLRQKGALEAQRAVTNTTNDLLLRNSEMLKQNTIEAAKENERSIVDIETLKKTQENFMYTVEETLKIQKEGRVRREAAERELAAMEEQMKQKLLNPYG